jgi:hypothetical protein
MTRLILETDNERTKRKIKDAIQIEAEILKKAIARIQDTLKVFETKYGKLDRKVLYGKVDDMELLEWEGELETLEKLRKRLLSLEEIAFEYR